MSQGIIEQIWEMAEPIVTEKGLELVDVEYMPGRGGGIVRIYIDNFDDGVTLANCVAVSKELSPLLDVHDVISGKYSLEVSSPGEERPLRKPKDFERYRGYLASFQLSEPIAIGRSGSRTARNIRVRIEGCDGEQVDVRTENEEILHIPLTCIRRAHLIADTGEHVLN